METTDKIAETLVRLIEDHCDADGSGSWAISIDVALRQFQVDTATFYRRLYERRDILETIAPKMFHPQNVTSLLVGVCPDYLECEAVFHNLGILLSVDHQLELTELIVEITSRSILDHEIDTELFAGMKRRYPNSVRAISVYIEYCFDIDEYTRSAIDRFLQIHPGMHERFARFQAKRLVELLFQRHILSEELLFSSIRNRLAPDSRRTRGATGESKPIRYLDPQIAEALSALGLSSLPETKADLKRVYRTLMKTYHPDVNPNGLAMSQKITHAYSLLMTTEALDASDAYDTAI
jgi:hypothetical protein